MKQYKKYFFCHKHNEYVDSHKNVENSNRVIEECKYKVCKICEYKDKIVVQVPIVKE